jgi:hypothetical protein
MFRTVTKQAVPTMPHYLDQSRVKRGTLIVPKWISAPYWPYIFDENLCYRTYVSDVLESKNTAGIFVPGTNPNSIFGKEPFITPVLAVKFQF